MAAYTKAEAIARIQQGIGFRSDLNAVILRALRDAQTLLETGQTLPWWLLSTTTTIVGVSGDTYVALPTGFIRFDDEVDIEYNDTTIGDATYPVSLVDYADLSALGRDPVTEVRSTGGARWLAIRGDRLYIAPTPQAVFTISASWYEQDEDLGNLDDDESNRWLTHGPLILIGLAGASVAADIREPDGAQTFSAMYQTANARMIADVEARKSRSYAVGSDL